MDQGGFWKPARRITRPTWLPFLLKLFCSASVCTCFLCALGGGGRPPVSPHPGPPPRVRYFVLPFPSSLHRGAEELPRAAPSDEVVPLGFPYSGSRVAHGERPLWAEQLIDPSRSPYHFLPPRPPHKSPGRAAWLPFCGSGGQAKSLLPTQEQRCVPVSALK